MEVGASHLLYEDASASLASQLRNAETGEGYRGCTAANVRRQYLIYSYGF